MGFGFASLLTSPIAQHLIAGVGLVETFYILGASYFIIMLLASQFIKRPNEQELAILSVSGKEKTASLTPRNGCESGPEKQSVLYTLDYFLYQHSLWYRLNFSGIANGTGDGWLVYKSCSSNGGAFLGDFSMGFGRFALGEFI